MKFGMQGSPWQTTICGALGRAAPATSFDTSQKDPEAAAYSCPRPVRSWDRRHCGTPHQLARPNIRDSLRSNEAASSAKLLPICMLNNCLSTVSAPIAVITKHAPSCSSCQLITSGQATPRPLSQMRRSRSPGHAAEAGAIFRTSEKQNHQILLPPLTGNQSECDSPKKNISSIQWRFLQFF